MQINTAKFTGKPVEVVPDRIDAPHKAVQTRPWWTKLIPMFAFAFGMGAIACLFAPPAAADLNLTFVGELFTSLFGALEDIVPSFESFMDVGFPVLIKVLIYVAIIGIIGMILWFGRSVLEKIVKMIGLTK
jgi:hypothetical protein